MMSSLRWFVGLYFPLTSLVLLSSLSFFSVAAQHARSLSSEASAVGPSTKVLPLIPHRIHRRRLLNSGRKLDAEQIGALYHGFGTHYIDLWCGTPPQRQTVIVDTGSGVTAFPCSGCNDCGAPTYHIDNYFMEKESSTFQQVPCGHCNKGSCNGHTSQCDISMSYQEGSSWHAFEAIDNCYVGGPHVNPLLEDDGGTDDLDPNHAKAFSAPIVFGCQTRLTGLFKTQLADGIMGMEIAQTSFWKQLHKAGTIKKEQFALCFSRPFEAEREGTVAGAMTLGGVDPRLDDTPLVYTAGAAGSNGFFGVKIRALYLRNGSGGESAKYDGDAKTISITVPSGNVIVDSGTTDTYFNSKISSSFRAAFHQLTGKTYDHKGMTLTAEELAKLPTILIQLHGDTIQNSDLPLDTVGLAGELDSDNPLDVILALPPSHYMELDHHNQYTARFYDDEGGGSVIGANAMMGHNVFFDVENNRIGWSESSCDYTHLLLENGYTSVLDKSHVTESENLARNNDDTGAGASLDEDDDSDSSGKKKKPKSGTNHDQEAPPEDITAAVLGFANACDTLLCRGGAITVLVIMISCCVCLVRCCCCPKKYSAVEPAYMRTEVEMSNGTSSYKDEEGFKDEPDDDDEEYGEFSPTPKFS